MIEGLLTLPVLLPVLFWAVYHYHKDRHLPEPPANLALCFGMGIVASWFSLGLYTALGFFDLRLDAVAMADSENLKGLFLYAVLAIGPIEELAKMLPYLLIVLRFKDFDDDLDGITYASFIALGYAAIENVHYLQFLTPVEAFARGFAGPVVHIVFASIWGYTIGHAHLQGKPLLWPTIWGFALSAVLHGVYDFFALMEPRSSLLAAGLLVLSIWIWRLVTIRRLARGQRQEQDI